MNTKKILDRFLSLYPQLESCPKPRIIVCGRMKRRLAEYEHLEDRQHIIRISKFWIDKYPEQFKEHVIPHEYAHWADYSLNGPCYVEDTNVQHGNKWKAIMVAYGIEPLITYEWAIR